MKSLFVYADFDWLDSPQFIGKLNYDSVRGNDTYGFAFSKDWLIEHKGLYLSNDLNNYSGIQYTRPGHEIFSCFL